MDIFYPQTLGGFIMVLTEEGDMIYLTENVNKYIGIVQVRSQLDYEEVIMAQIPVGGFRSKTIVLKYFLDKWISKLPVFVCC